MKKTISKRVYDTDNAELVTKTTFGLFGDPKGYEETLYKTADKGYYFLYVNGGSESPYTKEDIKSISAAKAEEWLKNN